nr:MAG TPA: hypothetical protein [Caudoviricetes sp.]
MRDSTCIKYGKDGGGFWALVRVLRSVRSSLRVGRAEWRLSGVVLMVLIACSLRRFWLILACRIV